MPGPIVDRDQELNIFATSLEGFSSPLSSILFVEDTSGQGKTRLLEKFYDHCIGKSIPRANIDLKSGSLTPYDILHTICKDILPLELPGLKKSLYNPYLTPQAVEIANNKAFGQTHYNVSTTFQVSRMSPDEKKQWWIAGAQALFEDLHLLSTSISKRFVILFDTFEKASPETRAWITDQILRMATPDRLPCLFVVVAGKQIPEHSGEWSRYSKTLTLQPLQLTDWFQYNELVHSTLSHEQIQQLYLKHQSNPFKMAETIGFFSQI